MKPPHTPITFMLKRKENRQDIKYDIVLKNNILVKVIHVDLITLAETHIMDLTYNGTMLYHTEHEQFGKQQNPVIEASKILCEFIEYNTRYINTLR